MEDFVPHGAVKSKQYIDEQDAYPPKGFSCVIPVVFAANDAYSVYASVAIESIFQHTSPGIYYRIYLLHTEISKYHTEGLESTHYEQGIIKCINISTLLENKDVVLYERLHFTKEMYYRLLIPEIFSCYDRVVYLDCDLILEIDIAEMFSIDMRDFLVAGVINPSLPFRRKQIKDFFDINAQYYINSGVLLFNIVQWRRERMVSRCFALLKTLPEEKLIYCDQDILNVACKGRIYYLDKSWNFLWHVEFWKRENIFHKIKEVHFKILHFSSNIKPWSHLDETLSGNFWKYARESRFYEEILFANFNKICEKKLNEKFHGGSCNSCDTFLKNSYSYRIGRAITFIPRKIRGGIRCYRENGMAYTLKRSYEKCKKLLRMS